MYIFSNSAKFNSLLFSLEFIIAEPTISYKFFEILLSWFKYTGASPIDFDNELMPGMCVNNDLCKINLKK